MGLFDSVEFECPKCGALLTAQSKAGDCDLQTYRFDDVPYRIAVDLSAKVCRCNCGATALLRFADVVTRVKMRIEELE